MTAGNLDRRIQFRRGTEGSSGFGAGTGATTWADYGTPRWASKMDVSDRERLASSGEANELTTRFVVRFDSLTTAVKQTDRLTCEGRTFGIVAIKEMPGRKRYLEISAVERRTE